MMPKKIQGYARFTPRVSRYDLYRTLHFASGGVANCRILPATKCKACYRPFNCGI